MVQTQAEAETLEETVGRHLDVRGRLRGDARPRGASAVSFAKRELLRLRRIGEQLQPVLRANLPLLPGEKPPYEGPRPTLNRVAKPSTEDD